MHRLVLNLKNLSLYDWECVMYGIAIFLLPFHTGHMTLSVSAFGSMGNKLSIFPVFIGLCLFIYRCTRKRECHIPKICIAFLGTFLIWQIFSLIHGVLIFPDWQEISANQFKKLDYLFSILAGKGIFLDTSVIGHIWWVAKLIITNILEYSVTYGTVLWGISLFYQNRKLPFIAFRNGILCGAFVCSAYSVIEFLYLLGSYDAMTVLAHINPFIYDVEIAHGWWPPLLGGNRVRSVFAEPAYMALFLTVSIPINIIQIHHCIHRKWLWKILLSMQIFMMWGTNSKTAMGIMLAEGSAACLFILLRRKQLRFKQIYRSVIALLLLCSVGIGFNRIFQHRYTIDYDLVSIDPDDTITLKVTNKSWIYWDQREKLALTGAWFTDDWQGECGRTEAYLDKSLLPGQSCQVQMKLPEPISKMVYPNIVIELETKNPLGKKHLLGAEGASKFSLQWDNNHWLDKGEVKPKDNKMTALTSKTEGSNQQRYGLMYVETLIGLDHWFLGVGGQQLKQAYFSSYIPDWLMKNREVKLWVKYQREKGFLNSGFPIISDYTHQFASYGLPGFLLYLMPSFYGLYLLIAKRKMWLQAKSQEYLRIAVLSISYFGLMVSFIGGNSTQLYIYWLLLGVLLGYLGTINEELPKEKIS
ncbi:MAG: hypothetical protein SPL23_13185 [Lachnospiraceae bacterium]|nr:hypothetical protein [Lachnospiraceae bacterium]